jgi:hypothetical protein
LKSESEEKKDYVDEIKKNTDKVIKTGIEFTKLASKKIDESTKIGIEKAKASPMLNKLKLKTEEATKAGIEKGKEIQEQSPGILKRLGHQLQLGFEKFVGTIRRGTQYGKTSIEMLEQFAKMKELGIITEEEFEAKKSEILDRI